MLVAAALLLSVVGGLYFATRTAAPPALAFSEFLKAVDAGKVTDVTFADPIIKVVLRDGSVAQTVAPPEFLAANGVIRQRSVPPGHSRRRDSRA